MIDRTCNECYHRAHVHSTEGSDTPGCRALGCFCERTGREVDHQLERTLPIVDVDEEWHEPQSMRAFSKKDEDEESRHDW